MRTSLLLVAVLFGLLSWAAAESPAYGQNAPPKPKPATSPSRAEVLADNFLGSLNQNQYTNKFFGVSLSVPEKYAVLNRAEISVYSNATSDLLKGDDAGRNRQLDEAYQNQAILIMIAAKQPGNAGNAIFEMSVRKQALGVRASMVLADSLKMMTASGKSILKKSLPLTMFGGRQFSGGEVETEVSGIILNQQFYVTMHRGYALVIAFTYAPGSDVHAFDSMLSGMVIKG